MWNKTPLRPPPALKALRAGESDGGQVRASSAAPEKWLSDFTGQAGGE